MMCENCNQEVALSYDVVIGVYCPGCGWRYPIVWKKDKPMDKPMKVRLTSSQILDVLDRHAEATKSGTVIYINKDSIIMEIAPEQIVREKSNREKWLKVFEKYKDEDGFFFSNRMAEFLDQNEVNADAAYRAVVGEE